MNMLKELDKARKRRENGKAMAFYPLLNDMQKRFEEAGARYKLRHNENPNRGGKTIYFCLEDAFHLTGMYPEQWKGKRFNRPVSMFCVSRNSAAQRDSTQAYLIGNNGQPGFIPPERIVGKPVMRPGAPGVVDIVYVRHESGGVSRLLFKTSDQDPITFAGSVIDIFHYDEDIGLRHWTECLRGTTTSQGIGYGAYTAVKTTELVIHIHEMARKTNGIIYLESGTQDFWSIQHLSDEEKKIFAGSVPEDEYKSRICGKATLSGAGLVYPVDLGSILVHNPAIEPGWKHIAGIDFGTIDGTAVVWIAMDPLNMRYIVYDELYMKSDTTADSYYRKIANEIISRGNIPVAWPHDGMRGSAIMKPIVSIYHDDYGVSMIPEPVSTRDGSFSDGVAKCLNLMQEGKLLVSDSCSQLVNALRTYHYGNDGKPAKKQKDHLPDAMRYALLKADMWARPIREYESSKPVQRRFRSWKY